MSRNITDEVATILTAVLQLGDRGSVLFEDTELLGSLPEFDSMSVIAVLTALEEYYGIFIEDDEIDATIFATVGTLTDFVEKKLAA